MFILIILLAGVTGAVSSFQEFGFNLEVIAMHALGAFILICLFNPKYVKWRKELDRESRRKGQLASNELKKLESDGYKEREKRDEEREKRAIVIKCEMAPIRANTKIIEARAEADRIKLMIEAFGGTQDYLSYLEINAQPEKTGRAADISLRRLKELGDINISLRALEDN